jgi:drug/metabolite transporter (DMT)-like permease
VILAIGAALGWGTADFLGGLKSRKLAMLAVLLVTQATALLLLLAVVTAFGEPLPARHYLLYAATAGLAEGLGVAALYRGLAVGTMSLVAPVASVAPAVPLVAGWLLGEIPGPLQIVGLALAGAGVFLTSCRARSPGAGAGKVASSTFYGLLSAAGFGVFFVALDAASEASIPWALFVARLSAVLALLVFALSGRFRLVAGRADLPLLLLIGVLIVASDAMYAIATTIGLLGIVAVVGALHTVVTIGLARVFLRERIARWQQFGIVACIVGVLVLTGASA